MIEEDDPPDFDDDDYAAPLWRDAKIDLPVAGLTPEQEAEALDKRRMARRRYRYPAALPTETACREKMGVPGVLTGLHCRDVVTTSKWYLRRVCKDVFYSGVRYALNYTLAGWPVHSMSTGPIGGPAGELDRDPVASLGVLRAQIERAGLPQWRPSIDWEFFGPTDPAKIRGKSYWDPQETIQEGSTEDPAKIQKGSTGGPAKIHGKLAPLRVPPWARKIRKNPSSGMRWMSPRRGAHGGDGTSLRGERPMFASDVWPKFLSLPSARTLYNWKTDGLFVGAVGEFLRRNRRG